MLDLEAILSGTPALPPTVQGAGAPGPSQYARQQPHARLDQSELVGSRELMTLAGSLMKRKNEKHAQLGRALVKAVRGELFAKHGERDLVMWSLCGEIINAYPNCDPEGVLSCFLAAISRAQDDGSDLSADRVRSMLERHQESRQLRLNMVNEIASGALGAALRDHEAKAALGDLPEPLTLSQTPAQVQLVPEPGALAPPGFDPQNLTYLIVQADGDYYLRHIQGWHYRRFKSQVALSIELTRLYGVNNATLVLYDQRGVKFPMQSILDAYATNARAVIYDYVTDRTTYDPATGVIRIGYEALPGSEVQPVADTDVEAWLQQLAGGTEADLLELYDWIAGTDRKRLATTSAACVIVGASDSGKSLLALCLALTWGTVPVPLKTAIDKFNGAILGGPIWHADERMPEDLTNDVFREMVQSRRRLVEPKGRERVQLEGASRIIVTLNDLEDLCINGSMGSDAVEAVADRLSIFSCRLVTPQVRAALDALRIPGEHDVDINRVARHLRFIQLNLTPRKQRFLGARLGNAATGHLLGQHIEKHSKVYEWLKDYLVTPGPFEREYSHERRSFSSGHRYPVITEAEQPWVWANELADKLGIKLWEVQKALQPFRTKEEGTRQLGFGPRDTRVRGRYFALDIDRLGEALALTASEVEAVVATLSTDTRTRLGQD